MKYFPDDEPIRSDGLSITRLNEQVQMLDEALAHLERNLMPVLRPERTEGTQESELFASDAMSPLHEQVEGMSGRVARAIKRIQSMDGRVDL